MNNAAPVQLRALVMAGCLLGMASVMATVTHANGRVTEFTRKTAGPYEIAVGTFPNPPAPGMLDLTITVADATSKAFILDATVTVNGRGPEDPQGGQPAEVGPLVAQANPPNFYDVLITVDRVGVWTFTVAVRGRLGEASAEFPIRVRSSSIIPGVVTLVALVVFVVLAGLSARMYFKGQGGSKRRHRK